MKMRSPRQRSIRSTPRNLRHDHNNLTAPPIMAASRSTTRPMAAFTTAASRNKRAGAQRLHPIARAIVERRTPNLDATRWLQWL